MMASQKEASIILTGLEISSVAPVGDQLTFLHSVFCQVGLPRSRVLGTEFMRRQGDAWISLHAGKLDEGFGPVQQELPYGPLPRLCLAHFSTYALRYGTREIPMGRSAAEFLGILGRSSSGGPRGGYRGLNLQMRALAACRLQVGMLGRTFNAHIVQEFDMWVHRKTNTATGILVLSEEYFQDLMRSGVPLDGRAVHALRGSALALDVYTWLAHRLHRAPISGTHLTWRILFLQFGQEYCGKRPLNDLQKDFKTALRQVKFVYPKANVSVDHEGLIMKRSDPPVQKVVSARRADPVQKAVE